MSAIHTAQLSFPLSSNSSAGTAHAPVIQRSGALRVGYRIICSAKYGPLRPCDFCDCAVFHVERGVSPHALRARCEGCRRGEVAFANLSTERNYPVSTIGTAVAPEMKVVSTSNEPAPKFNGEARDNHWLARNYAGRGFFVYPAMADGKAVVDRRLATTDIHTIDEWWGQWPHAVPVIDLARSKRAVLIAGKEGGVATAEKLFAEHGAVLSTGPAVSINGTHYYYFKHDGGQLGPVPAGLSLCRFIFAPGASLEDSGVAEIHVLRNGAVPPLPDFLRVKPSTIKLLQPDRSAVGEFVDSLFRHANPDAYVSLRAFRDDVDGKPPLFMHWVRVGAPDLVDQICEYIAKAANHADPYVFCPPVATFATPKTAATDNLSEGVALTVECDAGPEAARRTLVALLGPPTAQVYSGGTWQNPETGEAENKVHLHWRLKEPTRTPEEHKRLREARDLAATLVGGDASAKALVHPLRWPGSWHRKGEPRLARIEANPDVEIELMDALEKLREACPQQQDRPGDKQTAEALRAEDALDIAAALAVIPNNNVEWEEWNRIGMAVWAASGGRAFPAFDAWSQKSTKHDARTTKDRWDHYETSPPDRIGAGTLFYLAKQARPDWRKPSDSNKAPPPRPAPEPVQQAWPTMDEAAYYGLAGDIVRTMEPHTEADPVAILAQLLTYVGNVGGNTAHYQHEEDLHHTNLFVTLVGASSKGRKGVSGNRAKSVLKDVDPTWIADRMKGGLSSGEGLISEVRDEVRRWNVKDQEEEIIDPGVKDKRLMITEPEFARVLAVAQRQGNNLSMILRQAYDSSQLSTMMRNSPLIATNPHISQVTHITVEELRAELTRTDVANGFANRYMNFLVKRSKLLPHGGNLDVRVLGSLQPKPYREGRIQTRCERQPRWQARRCSGSSGARAKALRRSDRNPREDYAK
jgi:hypothetical protein